LVTGVTGFLGTAILERLLGDFPETRVSVMVRGRYGSPPEARLREVLASNAFRAIRDRVGPDGVRALGERVTIVPGDVVEELPELPPDLDVVFHCAATVSFDPAID